MSILRKKNAELLKPKKPKKTLKAKDPATPEDKEPIYKKYANEIRRFGYYLSLPLAILAPFFFTDVVTFTSNHLNYFIAPGLIIGYFIWYIVTDYYARYPGKGSRKQPQPPKIKLRSIIADSADIVANLDSMHWRILSLASIVISCGFPLYMPLKASHFQDSPIDWRYVGVAAGLPFLATSVVLFHVINIHRRRSGWRHEVYEQVAQPNLGYKPLPQRGKISKNQRICASADNAIEVKQWRNLYEGDSFFVHAPASLSSGNVEVWAKFTEDMDVKLYRPEEWRVTTTGYKGRGALVTPANYPRGVLWDGEVEKNPLSFVLGVDLDTGSPIKVTFGEVSPHCVVSGGTSSGKTSGVEAVAAQVLVKPMPWDSNLYGTVDLLDPKGPFASRWAGRPGVTASNGALDSQVNDPITTEDGDMIEYSGILVMRDHMEAIVEEYNRRVRLISKYDDIGSWVDLPEEVKRQEQWAPKFVILDEFLDFTSKANGKSAQVIAENDAKDYIVEKTDYLLRKSRYVGIHLFLIAQRANMKLIGDSIMTNAAMRWVTGQIDPSQLRSMFSKDSMAEIPYLPSSYLADTGETKTIPGRARIMNAGGQQIRRMQFSWFGGSSNSQTLNKYLPKGEKPLNGDFKPAPGKPGAVDELNQDLPEVLEEPAPAESFEDYEGEPDIDPVENLGDPEVSSEPQKSDKPDPEKEIEEEPVLFTEMDFPEWPAAEDVEFFVPEEKEDTAAEPSDAELNNVIVFPNADTSNICEEKDCGNEKTWVCPNCNSKFCSEHGNRSRNPDLADMANPWFCGNCVANHPYTRSGIARVIADHHERMNRGKYTYKVSMQDDGSARMRIFTPLEKERPLAEVYSIGTPNGNKYRMNSGKGAAEGFEEVKSKIRSLIG